MVVTVNREHLLSSISRVIGVVERKQTLPILGNFLIKIADERMLLIATDLEVEIRTVNPISSGDKEFTFTIPARKFSDICKSLPEAAEIQIVIEEDKALIKSGIKSGRSHFNLGILPADDYPSLDMAQVENSFTAESRLFKQLLDSTAFSMAIQDARYYLNGLLLSFYRGQLICVATDGHRLAVCERSVTTDLHELQLLLPRKAVSELVRLLDLSEQMVTLEIGMGFCRFRIGETNFTTKLIDGKFPDYQRVIPKNFDKTAIINRGDMRQALLRTSILSNERYKGVKLTFRPDELQLESSNTEHDGVDEEIRIEYQGDEVSIGFNISYLLDILNALSCENVAVDFTDSLSSIVVRNPDDADLLYVVMPMRL